MIAWQDKYERLHESHKRVQKINQSLEDKLLKLVDRNANERAQLTSDVATLSVRLAQANYNIGTLQREIVSVTPEVPLRKIRCLIAQCFFSLQERYKTDMGLAIQLLQCKPDSFVSQKVASVNMQSASSGIFNFLKRLFCFFPVAARDSNQSFAICSIGYAFAFRFGGQHKWSRHCHRKFISHFTRIGQSGVVVPVYITIACLRQR